MKLFNAEDDFRVRTLTQLPGLFRKLLYCASLRKNDGSFAHWGLEHVYGVENARTAIASNYEEQVSDLISRGLPELWEHIRNDSDRENSAQDMLVSLRRELTRYSETPFGEVRREHLMYVIDVLLRLEENRRPGIAA